MSFAAKNGAETLSTQTKARVAVERTEPRGSGTDGRTGYGNRQQEAGEWARCDGTTGCPKRSQLAPHRVDSPRCLASANFFIARKSSARRCRRETARVFRIPEAKGAVKNNGLQAKGQPSGPNGHTSRSPSPPCRFQPVRRAGLRPAPGAPAGDIHLERSRGGASPFGRRFAQRLGKPVSQRRN